MEGGVSVTEDATDDATVSLLGVVNVVEDDDVVVQPEDKPQMELVMLAQVTIAEVLEGWTTEWWW